MTIDVVKAEPSDLDVLSELLAEAFFDLPPSPWLIRDEDARRAIFPAYFRIHLEHGLKHGVVYTPADRAGVALWMPAGTDLPVLPDHYDEQLAAVTAPWTGRFVAFDVALETSHPVGRVHHHLALLGVGRGRRGHGIGSALLQAHHQQLDQDGLPAYLEASNRDNRKLYLRHWYVDHGPPISLPSGPNLFPMWREPHDLTSPGNHGNERQDPNFFTDQEQPSRLASLKNLDRDVSATLGSLPAPPHDDPHTPCRQPQKAMQAISALAAAYPESTLERRDLMDLAALIEGTPYTRCPCLTDESIHYHAERLLIMSILYAELWRMRTLRLLSVRRVIWSAPGGDDHELSKAAEENS